MDIFTSYETLALALKALGGGLWEYDIDSGELNCNRRWYEILGIDATATPVRSIEDFRPHIHPEDVDRATAVDFERITWLLENDEIYHVDFRIIRAAGEIRWIRSVACLIQDAATCHRKAVGCITDVTAFRSNGYSVLYEQPQRSEPNPVKAAATVPRLTRRERECLSWVSLGKSATETATLLQVSRRTVEFHLNNAVRKLGAVNKVHATAIAIRLALI